MKKPKKAKKPSKPNGKSRKKSTTKSNRNKSANRTTGRKAKKSKPTAKGRAVSNKGKNKVSKHSSKTKRKSTRKKSTGKRRSKVLLKKNKLFYMAGGKSVFINVVGNIDLVLETLNEEKQALISLFRARYNKYEMLPRGVIVVIDAIGEGDVSFTTAFVSPPEFNPLPKNVFDFTVESIETALLAMLAYDASLENNLQKTEVKFMYAENKA